ncbi:uncharacterized protein LOC108680700 [Hyalella azteca]|uniref:Uncharacterized protein LOC108680700 n=1 Tax=Hyalella azteca TaxID=294128 RepID=A0A8B7PIC1_HYAAZ|nr:uncharacterized protein LOC108680700 [Hyalella azteca]
MSHDGDWNRDVTERLIELYRQAPCLWKVKSSVYKDRISRHQALEKISEQMKKSDASMNIEKIRKKIHTLRNQFRSEMKRKKDTLKSGTGAEDSFTPRLWCFNILSFLTDGDEKRPSVSSLDEMEISASTPSISNENETSLMFSDTFEVPSDDSTFQQVQLPGLEHVECPYKGDNSDPTEQFDSSGRAEHSIIRPAVQPQRVMRSPTPTSDSSTSQPNEPKSVEFSRRPPLNKAQKRKRAEDSEAEILQMVATSLKEDELGEMTWGRAIGKDVAKLNREQSIIAKKLIRDAIFYGSLNMLKPLTRLTDLD